MIWLWIYLTVIDITRGRLPKVSAPGTEKSVASYCPARIARSPPAYNDRCVHLLSAAVQHSHRHLSWVLNLMRSLSINPQIWTLNPKTYSELHYNDLRRPAAAESHACRGLSVVKTRRLELLKFVRCLSQPPGKMCAPYSTHRQWFTFCFNWPTHHLVY